MEGFKTFVFIISLLFGIQISFGLSISCASIYDQDGVAAVLRSPECSHWHLSNQSLAMNCQFATNNEVDGQEDRMSCNLDMQIPFIGKNGTEYVKVGVVGIFDSIYGGEASDMASKLLLHYFLAHTMYLSTKVPSVYSQEIVGGYKNLNGEDRPLKKFPNAASGHATGKPQTIEESTHRRVLKDALLRTLHDIESTFLTEALEKKQTLVGTTATVAVLADGHILAANIGDSKAFLCSENINSHDITKGTLLVKEMTQDHSFTREDEKARFEAAGGRCSWFLDPICSILTMTRAIGHLGFKSDEEYHITAEPEVTDWQPLTDADAYLIFQTREVTRKLGTPQNVCNLLPHRYFMGALPVQCHVEASLAECIAFSAANKRLEPLDPCPPGSFKQMCDDEDEHHQGKGIGLSAIVVPLISSGFLQRPSV